jgi:hypothetical protein
MNDTHHEYRRDFIDAFHSDYKDVCIDVPQYDIVLSGYQSGQMGDR